MCNIEGSVKSFFYRDIEINTFVYTFVCKDESFDYISWL